MNYFKIYYLEKGEIMNISRLKILRIKNDYKQSEIANILNISQSQYCKYELGLNLINYLLDKNIEVLAIIRRNSSRKEITLYRVIQSFHAFFS